MATEPSAPVRLSSAATSVSRLDWRAALQRLHGAYAAKTLLAYAGDFSVFERWCETDGVEALPASASTLSGFVEAQTRRVAPRTVTRRLVAIRRIHGLLGLADATQDPQVGLAVRRGLRLRGSRARQALGLSASLRDRLLAACPASLKGARDRALIAVGYDTLCRRSELAGLRLEDLVLLPGSGAKVLVRHSKSDPYADGEYAYLSPGGLTHLAAWLQLSGVADGPIFRPIFKSAVGERALHPRAVNRALQTAARLAGCDPQIVERLSGHSMRVGAAQDLVVAGRTVLQIMRAGRWRNANAIAGYVRSADVNVWQIEAGRPPTP